MNEELPTFPNTDDFTEKIPTLPNHELPLLEGDRHVDTQSVESPINNISAPDMGVTPKDKPAPVDVNAVSPTQEIRVESETKPLSPLSPEKQQLLNNVDTLASMDPKTTPTEKILGFLRKLRGK